MGILIFKILFNFYIYDEEANSISRIQRRPKIAKYEKLYVGDEIMYWLSSQTAKDNIDK